MTVIVGPKRLVSPPAALAQIAFAFTAPSIQAGQVAFGARHADGFDTVIAWVNGVAKAPPGQFGGYVSTARTARRAVTSYGGVDAQAMIIPILLDGWVEQASIAPAQRLLHAMASPSASSKTDDDLIAPPIVHITGDVPFKDASTRWVIESLEPGEQTLYRAGDGSCLRQDYVITVIQAPPAHDGIIITNGKRYTVRHGDTLTSIAARQLGSAKRWRDIKNSKGHRIRDPKSVKPGQILVLP